MEYANASPFQHVLDLVEQMSIEDQQAVSELLAHRLIESRRADIARNAALTLQAIQKKDAQQGSIEDFKRDMLRDL